jgi:hypothetical protein
VAVSFARGERSLSNDEMAHLADEYLRRRGHDLDRLQYVLFGITTRSTSTATSSSTGSGPIGPWFLSSGANTSATRRRAEPWSGTSDFGL